MATESPSLLLQRAANHLDALSVRTSVTPWRVGPHGDTVEADPEAVAHDVLCDADAAWIAAVSPAVATPLVAWLRAAKTRFDGGAPTLPDGSYWVLQETLQAVEFARLILGEVSGE